MASNETLEHGCPEIPAEWPVDAWPAVNRNVGLFLFGFQACLFTGCVLFMFKRRHTNAYKARNVALVTVSAVGILAQTAQLSLREFVGREIWPCDTTLWFNYTALGMWLGPMVCTPSSFLRTHV
jgi:hypothetical protein